MPKTHPLLIKRIGTTRLYHAPGVMSPGLCAVFRVPVVYLFCFLPLLAFLFIKRCLPALGSRPLFFLCAFSHHSVTEFNQQAWVQQGGFFTFGRETSALRSMPGTPVKWLIGRCRRRLASWSSSGEAWPSPSNHGCYTGTPGSHRMIQCHTPFCEPAESAPEPAPFREPAESTPEPAPLRQPTESAPAAHRVRFRARSVPGAYTVRSRARSGSPHSPLQSPPNGLLLCLPCPSLLLCLCLQAPFHYMGLAPPSLPLLRPRSAVPLVGSSGTSGSCSFKGGFCHESRPGDDPSHHQRSSWTQLL